jgi:hypothetical protein
VITISDFSFSSGMIKLIVKWPSFGFGKRLIISELASYLIVDPTSNSIGEEVVVAFKLSVAIAVIE